MDTRGAKISVSNPGETEVVAHQEIPTQRLYVHEAWVMSRGVDYGRQPRKENSMESGEPLEKFNDGTEGQKGRNVCLNISRSINNVMLHTTR